MLQLLFVLFKLRIMGLERLLPMFFGVVSFIDVFDVFFFFLLLFVPEFSRPMLVIPELCYAKVVVQEDFQKTIRFV